MRQTAPVPSPQPFFLPASPGERFCVYYPPATAACRANVLHVHAFGEEMNKSRRMVALQARALAQLGIGVLLIDLYGCGDSSGDFSDARWEIWLEDLAGALNWLRRREQAPIVLWGLRLGALLMLDYAKASGGGFDSFLLWQPVVSGETYLTQFLRLRVANDMMAGDKNRVGTRELREVLKGGEPLEIAGYGLSPELAMTLDTRRLVDLCVPGASYHWFEVVAGEGAEVSPASRRVIDQWAGQGVKVNATAVAGDPFWTTQEITECRPLIAATSTVFSDIP